VSSQGSMNTSQSSEESDLVKVRKRALKNLRTKYAPWYERFPGWLEHRLRLPRVFHIPLGVAVFLLACWGMVPLGAADHYTWYWSVMICVALAWAYAVWFLWTMRDLTLRLAPEIVETLTSEEQIDAIERCWALIYVSRGQMLVTIVGSIIEIVLLFVSGVIPLLFFGIYPATTALIMGFMGGAAIWVVSTSLYLLRTFARFDHIRFNWLAPAKSVSVMCMASYYVRQATLFVIGSIQWDIIFVLGRVEGLNRLTWPFIGAFSIIAGITLIYNPLLFILPKSTLETMVKRLKNQVRGKIEKQIAEIYDKKMASGEPWSESLEPYQELLTQIDESPNSPVDLGGVLRFLGPQIGSMLTLFATGIEYRTWLTSIVEWVRAEMLR